MSTVLGAGLSYITDFNRFRTLVRVYAQEDADYS